MKTPRLYVEQSVPGMVSADEIVEDAVPLLNDEMEFPRAVVVRVAKLYRVVLFTSENELGSCSVQIGHRNIEDAAARASRIVHWARIEAGVISRRGAA